MTKKNKIRIFLAAFAAVLVSAVCLSLLAEYKLSRLAPGGLGEAFPTRIYSAPFEVRTGGFTPPGSLLRRLGRLGYRALEKPSVPGEYSWQPPILTVSLRGFRTPSARQEPFEAELEYGRDGWEIRVTTGAETVSVLLEPELAAELSGPNKVRREPAEAADIPERLRFAVIAVEDKRFMRHHGVDFKATAGALWRNLTRRGLWGGSTITQQLAKNIFLTPRRTLRRKLAEAFLAVYLERRYTKQEILVLYLNQIYLGQDGHVSVAGVRSAGKFYFGKEPAGLSLAECAMLAGIISSPYRYNPRRDASVALARRSYALSRMFAEGMITLSERAGAEAEPLTLAELPYRPEKDDNAYFTAEVVRRLMQRHDEDEVFRFGLAVYTTLDTELQAAASEAVRQARFEAALAAIDPDSGAVLALVGGKAYGRSQFNRATQAQRQPGSAFKPFVYGAALEAGFTPATLLEDSPRRYHNPGGARWDPHNYGGVYYGTSTLRMALARSLNSATLDLAGRVGLPKITAFAGRLGVKSPLENSLAVALGASEVNLLELTAAYAPFANGGFRVEPVLITAVEDARGNLLEYGGWQRTPVIQPALASLMTSLLESVVREGTAAVLGRVYGWVLSAAGKTGTTNGGRDAWFIGYTPRLLAGVWAGDDSNRAVGAVGATDALPLWAAFMKTALGGQPAGKFTTPAEGLSSVKIDPASGLLAVAGCPERRTEIFLAGTEPVKKCPQHSRGLTGWFKRLFSIK
ncbi:MAG: PBP1A family penicillin-binding protein [Elusimicrobia bacterium]|nr:PBP1A family penicillin-binding protein [Elusimicrobiota bacterium]